VFPVALYEAATQRGAAHAHVGNIDQPQRALRSPDDVPQVQRAEIDALEVQLVDEPGQGLHQAFPAFLSAFQQLAQGLPGEWSVGHGCPACLVQAEQLTGFKGRDAKFSKSRRVGKETPRMGAEQGRGQPALAPEQLEVIAVGQ